MIGATLTTRLAQDGIDKKTVTAFSLAFLAGLVVTLGVVSQQWLPTLVAALFLVGLTFAVLRIAGIEVAGARAMGNERYKGYMQTLGRRLAAGDRFLRELSRDVRPLEAGFETDEEPNGDPG